MPLEYRCCTEPIGNQPDKKGCRNQGGGQHGGGVSANGRATENFGPHRRVRNQAADAVDSFGASQIDDKLEFTGTFKNQPKKQNDRQGDKRMDIEQRHRRVKRERDPEGQGTLPVSSLVDRGGLARVICLHGGFAGRFGVGRGELAGVAAPGYNDLAKEFFAPMPKQNQSCRDRVKPAPLRHEHR